MSGARSQMRIPDSPLLTPFRPEVVKTQDNFRTLAYGSSMPTSWTTIYPRSGENNSRTRTSITDAVFKSNGAGSFTLEISYLSPDGTRYEAAPQAQLLADGEFWIPFKRDSREAVIEPGWSLQILCSGANSIAYKIDGIERWLPS